MQDERQSDTVDDLTVGGPPLWPVRVDAAGRTHRGKVRPDNQDSFHVARFGRFFQTVTSSLTDPQALEEFENIGYAFSVADGLGGHAAGEVASRRAVALPRPSESCGPPRGGRRRSARTRRPPPGACPNP